MLRHRHEIQKAARRVHFFFQGLRNRYIISQYISVIKNRKSSYYAASPIMEWIKWKGPSIPRFASCPMQTAQGSTRRIKLSAKRSNDLIWNLLRLGDVQVRWCIDGGTRLPKANGTAAGASNEEIKSTYRRGGGGGGGRGSAENDFFACVLRSSNSFTRPLGCCFLVSRIIDNCKHVSKVDERSELYCETVWLNIMGGIKICVSLFTWWYNFRIFIKLFCWLDIFEIESLFFKAIWINK